MNAEPKTEHQWLQKLVGDWDFKGEMMTEPDKPAEAYGGTETYHSLGGVWFIGEGTGAMAGGDASQTRVTIGYTPAQGKYVGTWVGSMHTTLFVYEGALNAEQTALTLETEGPSMADDGTTARYRDVIEFLSDDYRTLTSYAQDGDGNWQRFVTTHYHRKK